MDENGNIPDSARLGVPNGHCIPNESNHNSPSRFARKMLSSAKPSEIAKSMANDSDDSPSVGISFNTDSKMLEVDDNDGISKFSAAL